MFISIVSDVLGYLEPARAKVPKIEHSAPEQADLMLCSALFCKFIIGSYWLEVVN